MKKIETEIVTFQLFHFYMKVSNWNEIKNIFNSLIKIIIKEK